jgi:hypothetical protein
MAVDKAAVGKFMEVQKQTYDRCMYDDFSCKNKLIRAHSVQNGKVLDVLQKDNHVIVPKRKFDAQKGPSIELGLVGRNNALTFTGLCSEHDNALFKLADTLPLDITNYEQISQHAYRAIMKELHTCIEIEDQFFKLDAGNVKAGITKPGEGAAAHMAAHFANKAWRLFRYRSQTFDTPRSNGEEPPMEHQIITMTGLKPTVAVSAFFGLGAEENGDIIGVALTAIPETDKTTAILSYASAQSEAIKKAVPAFFDENSDPRKPLSHLILQRVENFTLSPEFYDGWSEDKKKKVIEYFDKSMWTGEAPQEDAEFSLFEEK